MTQYVITALLLKDFARRAVILSERREESLTQVASADRLDDLVECLGVSARAGLLSPGSEDLPHGGRPVLTLRSIQDIDPRRWGKLKAKMYDHLAESYNGCPPDAWDQMAALRPRRVVLQFLHHVFLVYGSPEDGGEGTWSIIRGQHPDYARAVQRSLAAVNSYEYLDTWIDRAVRIDAGVAAEDSRQWLLDLEQATLTGRFGEVKRAIPGRPF